MPRDRSPHIVRTACDAIAFDRRPDGQPLHFVRVTITPGGDIFFVRQIRDDATWIDYDGAIPVPFLSVMTPLSGQRFAHGMYGVAINLRDFMAMLGSWYTPSDFGESAAAYILIQGEWDGISVTTHEHPSAPIGAYGFTQTINNLYYSDYRDQDDWLGDGGFTHVFNRIRKINGVPEPAPAYASAPVWVYDSHVRSPDLPTRIIEPSRTVTAVFSGDKWLIARSADPETIVCNNLECP